MRAYRWIEGAVLLVSTAVVTAFVAGGADSYGYLSQARLWSHGTLQIEQPIIGRAPLRRRCKRRKAGLADVFQAARPEQLDRGQESRGLLRRDRKSVDAQQRDKGDEDADGARKCKFVAHAAASAISASSRGEI